MAFRRWIWVEDTQTHHRFDVEERQLERLLRTGAVEVVPNYPVNEGQNVPPRPAKHNVNLGKRADEAPSGEVETPDVAPAAAPASTPAPPRRPSSRTATAAPEADTTNAEGTAS